MPIVKTAGMGDHKGGNNLSRIKSQQANQLSQIQQQLANLNAANAAAGPMGYESDIEDYWQPGVLEATRLYNQGLDPLDPMGYLDQSMANLQMLQNPQQNPYLQDMLKTGQQSIAEQTMGSLGLSGRAPGMIDPVTGQASDSAINLVDNLGDFTTDFLGNQYQQDMNRAMQATQAGLTLTPDVLNLQQSQPWVNLGRYTDVASRLTGSSPQQPNDPKVSGWQKLMGIGQLGIGGALAGIF